MTASRIAVNLVMIVLALCLLGAAPPEKSDDPWAVGKWNEKLGAEYAEWKPVEAALKELAARAGVDEVVFAEPVKGTFMVPLGAEMSLREAFLAVASLGKLQAAWVDGKLTVSPARRAGDWVAVIGGESRAITFGKHRGRLIVPKGLKGKGPVPWVWYAPNGVWQAHAWMAKRFLAQGVALAVVGVGESQGNPAGREVFTAFHASLVKDHGLARRAALMPQSRGGLMLYNWASEHADNVAAVGGIYTVCDLRSYPGMPRAAKAYGMTEAALAASLASHNPIDRLSPLVKAKVPIFHIHGDKDGVVPVEKNAGLLVKRYKALGGEAEIEIVPGKGHAVLAEFFQNQKLTDFLIRHAKAAAEGERKAEAKKQSK